MAPSPIRILFVELPRIVRDMISAIIDRQPDMEVVGEAEPGEDLGAVAALLDADFVIVGFDGASLPRAAQELFERRGALKVIGIAHGDGSAYLYRLRPERRYIGELSPEEITSAIRLAAEAA